jgi:hypothetical protein
VPAGEGRAVAELLDDSDGLAREALLDMSADRALGMVRGWPQLMQSAAELWAVLPTDPTVSANGDPIAILAAMGRAVGRSLAAGHWPGRGPTDEAWEQIASNFEQAKRLRQRQVLSEATDGQTDPTGAKTQILHALYVATQLAGWVALCPCVPPEHQDHDQDAHNAPSVARNAQLPIRRTFGERSLSRGLGAAFAPCAGRPAVS